MRGLLRVGFAAEPTSGGDLLMVVSHDGRGLFDPVTGAKIASDREPDPDLCISTGADLSCPGFGPLVDTRVCIAGLFGGGLHTTTDADWTVDVVAPDWPVSVRAWRGSRVGVCSSRWRRAVRWARLVPSRTPGGSGVEAGSLCDRCLRLYPCAVPYADLSFEQWNDLSDGVARRMACEIADRHDLTVVGLKHTAYAERSHRVALFDRDGMRFALVPGGRPALGYDAARFQPVPDQAASYADSASEYGLPPLAEYVDAMTSPVRSAEMAAILIAVEAFDPCEIPLAPDNPRVLELVASTGDRLDGVSTLRSGGGLTVEFDRTGQVARARATREVAYDEAMAGLASIGLRTTTEDQWEWARGAGATTLFRWGDDCPNDGYPFDYKTGPHRQKNLWGLAIGQDPYRHEATTDRTIVCGGDGGGATCGGSGFFLGWLTLATAYRDKDFGHWLASDDGYADEILTRPVIELN